MTTDLLATVPKWLRGATHFCSDDPAFGQLFNGRYMHALWEGIVPPRGVPLIASAALHDGSRWFDANNINHSGQDASGGVGGAFADFLVSAKVEFASDLNSIGAAAALSPAASRVSAVDAVRALHDGPVDFVLNQLGGFVNTGVSALWGAGSSTVREPRRWTDAICSAADLAARFARRVVVHAFSVADLVRRRTSFIDLILDAAAHIDTALLAHARRLNPRVVLAMLRAEAMTLAYHHVATAVLTTVAFRIGQRRLMQELGYSDVLAAMPATSTTESADTTTTTMLPDVPAGLPKAQLLRNNLLMAALFEASSPALSNFFFSRLWVLRLLQYMRRKVRRAPLLFVPTCVKRALGFRVTRTAFPSGERELDSDTVQSALFFQACLEAGVTRTVLQRNGISLVKTIVEEHYIWCDGYRRAYMCNATPYVFQTLFKYHVLSSVTLCVHMGASMGVRVAAAGIGHRVMRGHGMGAYWLEAAMHVFMQKRVRAAAMYLANLAAQGWDSAFPNFGAPFGEVEPDDILAAAEQEYATQRAAKKRRQGTNPADGSTTDEGQHPHDNGPERQASTSSPPEQSQPMGEDEWERQARDDVLSAEDYYNVLGVAPTATEDEIRKAYRRQALKVHPDKVQHLSPAERAEATANFKKLSQANGVLADPRKRREYDNFRRACDPVDKNSNLPGGITHELFQAMPPWMRRSSFAAGVGYLANASAPVQLSVASGVGYLTVLLAFTLLEGRLAAELRKGTVLGVIV